MLVAGLLLLAVTLTSCSKAEHHSRLAQQIESSDCRGCAPDPARSISAWQGMGVLLNSVRRFDRARPFVIMTMTSAPSRDPDLQSLAQAYAPVELVPVLEGSHRR
jgi:hypothetical protein